MVLMFIGASFNDIRTLRFLDNSIGEKNDHCVFVIKRDTLRGNVYYAFVLPLFDHVFKHVIKQLV